MIVLRLVIIMVAMLLLGVAAVLVLIRMAKGPSTLDRVVAADVMLAVVIAGLGLEAALNRHGTTVPVILVLSLLGFASALSMARFVADRDKAKKWDVPTHLAAGVPDRGGSRGGQERADGLGTANGGDTADGPAPTGEVPR
jgi:multicomponent Na+:H+ antiporter subunit F